MYISFSYKAPWEYCRVVYHSRHAEEQSRMLDIDNQQHRYTISCSWLPHIYPNLFFLLHSRKIIRWWIYVKAGMNIESHNMIYLSINFTEIHLEINISLQWSWHYFLHLSTISLSRTRLGNHYEWGNQLVGYLGCWFSMLTTNEWEFIL